MEWIAEKHSRIGRQDLVNSIGACALRIWMNGYCFKVKNLATGTIYTNEFMNVGTAKRFAEKKAMTLKCFGRM